jgi:hypothetical protein
LISVGSGVGIGSFGGPGGESEDDDTEARNVNPGIICEGKSLFERVNEEIIPIFLRVNIEKELKERIA